MLLAGADHVNVHVWIRHACGINACWSRKDRPVGLEERRGGAGFLLSCSGDGREHLEAMFLKRR